MLARFRTIETVLLLSALLAGLIGLGVVVHLGRVWIAVLCASFVLLAFPSLAARAQHRLLERYLARGNFTGALRIATAVRAGKRLGVGRELAELDVGLVHLARGANADALRSFRRIELHRLPVRTRSVVATYAALAELRSTQRKAEELIAAADEALASQQDDPYLLAAKGEALLSQGDANGAEEMLARSLKLDPDPCDPSPGERYLLFARAAARTGRLDLARKSFHIAAQLRAEGPFVRAARAELAELESRT